MDSSLVNSIVKNTSTGTQLLKDMLNVGKPPSLHSATCTTDSSQDALVPIVNSCSSIINGDQGLIIDFSDPDDKIFNAEPDKNQDKYKVTEMISTPQKIVLQGSDEDFSYNIYGKEVDIVSSTVSNSILSTQGSSKVKITPVVDFPWENKYYIGQLVAAHKEGMCIAYTLKSKSGGAVRIMHRKSAQRVLLKGFTGAIKDISFAHLTKKILIACVDEFGNLYIYEILEENCNLRSEIVLHVSRKETVKSSDYHRVIWCPYIPDDPGAEDEDIAQLLVITHEEKAEIWNIDVVIKHHTKNHLSIEEIDTGYQTTSSHEEHITDAMLSPDGSALATVSEDGEIKFFQVYLYDTSSSASSFNHCRCLHQWKPHGGKPVSRLFFLDNHKNCNPEIQFWKYAITGCEHNSELKLWSCESWTCLQTIRFLPSPKDNIKPCLQVCLDLSGSFLVMSDINRKVLYVLQICPDPNTPLGSIHVTCISEFILTHPMLSFAVIDAGLKKVLKLPETENIDFITGDFSKPDEEEQVKDDEQTSVGILVRLYSVHPKSLQELEIQFQSESTANLSSAISISTLSQDDMMFRDGLSDMSIETSTSDADNTQPEDLLSKPLTAKEKLPLAEVLLTPDSFKPAVSSPHRHLDSLNLDLARSNCTSTSSLTQVTNLNDCPTTPHSSVDISDESAPSSSGLSSSSSQDANEQNLTSPSMSIQHKSSSVFPNNNNCISSNLPAYQPVATSETIDEILHQQQQRRHLMSTSSSPSLEVSEILATLEDNGNQNKPEVNHDWDGEINQEQPNSLSDSTRHDYDLKIWPLAPDIPPDSQRPPAETRPSQETSDEEVIEDEIPIPLLTMKNSELHHEETQPGTSTTTVSIPSELVQSITDILNVLRYQQKEIAEIKNEFKQQRRLVVTVQSLASKMDKLEGVIISRIERALMQHNQISNQKLNEALKQHQNIGKNMHDQLLTSLSQSLNNTLSLKLEKTVKSEITTNLVPGVTKLIEPIKECLMADVAQRLTATDAIMKDNIGKLVRSRTTVEAIGIAAAGALHGPIQVSYRDAFQNTVVPVFEKACQNMFQQINDAFHKGTREYVQQLESHLDSRRKQIQEARDPALTQLQNITESFQATADQLTKSLSSNVQQQFTQNLQESLNRLQDTLVIKVRELVKDEISKAMKDQQTVIGDSVLNAMRSGAVTPITSTPVDPQLQQAHILHLLRQGQLNAAFQQALSASDLNLVMFVCETVNPSQVFNQTPCPLQQAVLLSLIQQLSAELNTNIELKHKYLEEAIMNLDTGNLITKEHMPAILTALVQKLSTYIQLHPTDKITRNMRMLLMAAQSFLK